LKRKRGGSHRGSKIQILEQPGLELIERRRQADQQEQPEAPNLPAVQGGRAALSQSLRPAEPPKEGERGAGEREATLKVGAELARGESEKNGRSL
jgi:hypothetical protein